MPYKSPASKRKKNIKDPPVRIPDAIRLPDGREVALDTVTNKVTNKTNYNLRAGLAYTHHGKRKMIKNIVDTHEKL